MRTATLIFYAIATLFLGELVASLGIGGPLLAILDALAPGSSALLRGLTYGIALVGPLYFLGLAAINAWSTATGRGGA